MDKIGSGDDCINQNRVPENESESLLRKYDIPVDHLDFKYINTCDNVKEIEKIYHILQSGQEGYYPDLLKCAENRLCELNPNSKRLWKQRPILTKADFDKEEWNNMSNDVTNWVNDMNKNDQELLTFRNSKDDCKIPVRDPNKEFKKKTQKKIDRIKSMEYEKWDKFDVDAEILKMDIKEEKLVKENIKEQEEKEKLNTVVIKPDYMTEAELLHAAAQEKNRGNEFYKEGEYEEALQYYTNSLNFQSNPTVYNNRAITYIKLNQFEKALQDTKEVLKVEPLNIKALLRKALSLKHLKKYDEAMKSLETLIRIDPNNNLAQSMINDISAKTKSKPARSVRMVIQDEKPEEPKQRKENSKVSNKTETLLSAKQQNRDVVVPIPGTSNDSPPYYKVVNVTKELEQKYLQSCKKTHHPSDDNVIDLNEWKVDEVKPKLEPIKESSENVNLGDNGAGEPRINICDISPYEFIKRWQNIKSDKSLGKLSQVLRNINPNDIISVIGNKLDGQMLSLVLQCLEKYFMNSEDAKLVSSILTNFSKLPRFEIIAMLLNKEEKEIASNIIRFISSCGYPLSSDVSRIF